MAKAFTIYRKMVNETRRNIQHAVYQQGPYRLAPNLKKHEVSEEKWLQLSPQEQTQLLAKVDPSVVKDIDNLAMHDPISLKKIRF